MAAGTPELDDAALLAATRAGDAEAFGLLYRRHADAARRLAGRLLPGVPEHRAAQRLLHRPAPRPAAGVHRRPERLRDGRGAARPGRGGAGAAVRGAGLRPTARAVADGALAHRGTG